MLKKRSLRAAYSVYIILLCANIYGQVDTSNVQVDTSNVPIDTSIVQIATSSIQIDTLSVHIDPTYFKDGKDSWNLIEAVNKNDIYAVNLLLSRGADANAVSSTGNSALMYATEKGNMKIMQALVNNGANVNAVGFNSETPLILAIFHNDFQATKYLLEHGANPNLKDRFSVTPLIYAAATNQYQTADLLMFYEADPTVRDDMGNDPLLAAVTFENIETSDVLLQNGLSPDSQDKEGNTPAIVATQHGNYDILELLTDYNADINIPNKKQYSPLAYAMVYKDVKASKLLVDRGADVQYKINNGRNIAELARLSGNDTLKSLVEENGGKLLTKADFSEFHFAWVNNFNATDYLLGLRGMIYDTKYGFYFGTGIDFRPMLIKTQLLENDTIFQFRERRIGWSQTIGKDFSLYSSAKGINLAAFTSLNGYWSFPRFAGSNSNDKSQYHFIPEGGLAISGKYVGLKAGISWINFDNILDKGLKCNVSMFFKIKQFEEHYDRKEIYWE